MLSCVEWKINNSGMQEPIIRYCENDECAGEIFFMSPSTSS
jgi:hypothetical protein